MKKIHLFILTAVLLLCGCSPKASVQNSNEDDGNWNLEANYSILQNTFSDYRTMEIAEDSILVFPPTEKDKNGMHSYVTGYINNNEITLFSKSVSSTCSIYDHSGCQGIFSIYEVPLNYYKGKLYYITRGYNKDTDSYDFYLMRCDIDGSHQEKLYQFDMSGINIYTGSYPSSFIQFCNNTIYIEHFGKLYYADIQSLDIREMKLENVRNIWAIFAYDDVLYIRADEYNDGNKAHFYVTLECDLNGKIKNLLHEDAYSLLIDDKNMFFVNDNDEGYMINRQTNTRKDLFNSGYIILKHDNTYLLDDGLFKDMSTIMILNEDGDVILKRECPAEEKHIPQIYTGDRLYVSKDDWFGYYEISDEGISDLIMFPSPE